MKNLFSHLSFVLVATFWILIPQAFSQDENFLRFPEEPEGQGKKVFYRWASKNENLPLLLPGRLIGLNFRRYLLNTSDMAGAGIYMAESPVSSVSYGEELIEVVVGKKILSPDTIYCYYDYSHWWVIKVDKLMLGERNELERLFRFIDPLHLENRDLDIRFRPFLGQKFNRKEIKDFIANGLASNKEKIFQDVLDKRYYRWGCSNKQAVCLEYTDQNEFISSIYSSLCDEGEKEMMEKSCQEMVYSNPDDATNLEKTLTGKLGKKIQRVGSGH